MEFLKEKDARITPPKKGSHKGDNGRVLVIGGSEDYAGAPYFAAMAALRIGADYVAIACPRRAGFAINSLSPDIITKKFDCRYFSRSEAKEVIDFSKKFDSVLIGNGLSDKKESMEFVDKIVYKIKKPLVIDADALKAVDILKLRKTILTPHKKEYEALTSDITNLKKAIGDNIIIRKGPVDEIITKDETFYNKTGCDRMAVAGTGDILAGLAAGLLAKGYKPVEAAKKAAYINGILGKKARKDYGDHFVASDMLGYIKKL